MGQEQRKYRRHRLNVELHARDEHVEGDLVFESIDLSAGGTFLRSDLLLEQDESLTIEFRLPRVLHPICAQAKVVWVRRFPKPGEAAGMGLQFLSMDAGDRAELERYLEEAAQEEAAQDEPA